MTIIQKYFPHLTLRQQEQMSALWDLYHEWNEKINVISRKDIDNLYEHHVLHSLAIAYALKFREGTQVLDFGTGGGFPGIPLAILFPDSHFTLIDGTGKKILVVKAISEAIGLKNVTAKHLRGEEERGRYDFVVSRAVMPLPDLLKIVRKNIAKTSRNSIANGILCLKGGNVESEVQPFHKLAEVTALSNWFEEEWFNEKHLIYLQI